MGYSKKGWITGEVTSQYVLIFADQTKPAMSGQPWLLIVDGHASHYSRGFLEGALKNNIHVICYPSHTTHIFQALNVSLFGLLRPPLCKNEIATSKSTMSQYPRSHSFTSLRQHCCRCS